MANFGREELSGGHDAGIPGEFLDFMAGGWRDEPVDVAPVPQLAHLARRRARLSAAFPGETLVIPTGQIRSRTFGAPFPFRGGSDFIWLTGDQDPGSVLVLHPTAGGHDAVLYAQPRYDATSGVTYLDRMHGEVWHGRRYSEKEKSALLGIETRDLADLPGALRKAAAGPGVTRVLRGFDEAIDESLLPAAPERSESDGRLATVLSELRLEKDEWEIAQLRDAVDATIRGFEDVARVLPADGKIPERVLEGVFALRARVDGNGVGYNSIVAGGAHSTILHWDRNDGTVEPGGVLLMDMGVEGRSCYTADVTRVLPVSGTFTTAQRDVYDIVHAARDAGLAAMAPGAAFRDIHLTCMRVLTEGLHGLGILDRGVEEAMDSERQLYRRWTLHGFGHMLGLDVHDCGYAGPEAYGQGRLGENYVLTMEPGLYFQPNDERVPEELRGIGVRLEDDVLVTKDGCELLTAALPTEAGEVESWLATQREAGPRLPGTGGVTD